MGSGSPTSSGGSVGIQLDGGSILLDTANTLQIVGTGGGTAGSGNVGVSLTNANIVCASTGCTPTITGMGGFFSTGVLLSAFTALDMDWNIVGTSDPLGGNGIDLIGPVVVTSTSITRFTGTTTAPGFYGINCGPSCGVENTDNGLLSFVGSGVGGNDLFFDNLTHPSKSGNVVDFDGTVSAGTINMATGPYAVFLRDGGTIGTLILGCNSAQISGNLNIQFPSQVQCVTTLGAFGSTVLDIDGSGTLTFLQQVSLSSSLDMQGFGTIAFQDTLDGSVVVTSSIAQVEFNSDIGGGTPLNSLSVISPLTILGSSASITATGDVVLATALQLPLSPSSHLITAAGFTLAGSSASSPATITVSVPGTIDFSNGLYEHAATFVTGGTLLFDADFGPGSVVTVEDSTLVGFQGGSADTFVATDNVALAFQTAQACVAINDFQLSASATVEFLLADSAPCTGYTQISSVGSVSYSFTTAATLTQAGTIVRGTDYTLVDYVGTPTSQEFPSHPSGTVLTLGGVAMVVSYPASAFVVHANTLPVATDDSFTFVQFGLAAEPPPGVLANDVDPDGPSTLTATLVTGPGADGSVSLGATGGFTFSPAPNFTGLTSFTYQLSDGLEVSNIATVTISYTYPSPSTTPSPSRTPSISTTSTVSLSNTASASTSRSVTPTVTPTPSRTASITRTRTISVSPSETASVTATVTRTRTVTPTATPTRSTTATASPSFTSTASASGPPPSAPPTPPPTPLPTLDAGTPLPSIAPEPSGALPSVSASQTKAPSASCTVNCSPPASPSAGGAGGVGGTGAGGGAGTYYGGATVPTEVTTITGDGSPVPVVDSDGNEVAEVMITDGTGGVLVVNSPGANSGLVFPPSLSSPVLDIRVFGADGQEQKDFGDDGVEICFAENGIDPDDVCLGFFNDDGDWECEDYCLSASSAGVCGKSGHLTNFALLLDSEAGSDSKCGSTDNSDLIYVYLSASLVCCAVLIVLVAAVAIETRIRIKKHQVNSQLTVRSSSTA